MECFLAIVAQQNYKFLSYLSLCHDVHVVDLWTSSCPPVVESKGQCAQYTQYPRQMGSIFVESPENSFETSGAIIPHKAENRL